LLIAATLTIVGVSATNSQAMAQGKKVTVGINSLTAIYWPTYVARAKGLYARHGLDADIVLVGSPVAGVQQLIGRSIDIAHPTLYVAVNALAHGADLRLIGCIVNTLPYSMIASPKLTSVKDLVGKSVILAFRTDVMTLMWRDWVKAQGVDPEGIDQIYDAQAANRYAALANGSAWASMLNAPFDLRAQGEGYKRLLDFGPISEGYAMAVVAARPDYIAANPEALRSYLAATREAIDWLYDPANRAEAIAILAKDTKQDAGISAATYDDLVVRQKPYDRNLDLPDSFLKKTLDGVIANGDASKGSTLAANVKDLSLRPR
jgi:NitT/TauT family transport system substrate-binding protein